MVLEFSFLLSVVTFPTIQLEKERNASGFCDNSTSSSQGVDFEFDGFVAWVGYCE
jgi:hypothetical protein